MKTASISVRVQRDVLRQLQEAVRVGSYYNISDFLRDAIRDKLKELDERTGSRKATVE